MNEELLTYEEWVLKHGEPFELIGFDDYALEIYDANRDGILNDGGYNSELRIYQRHRNTQKKRDAMQAEYGTWASNKALENALREDRNANGYNNYYKSYKAKYSTSDPLNVSNVNRNYSINGSEFLNLASDSINSGNSKKFTHYLLVGVVVIIIIAIS